jgi:hypothetical protein
MPSHGPKIFTTQVMIIYGLFRVNPFLERYLKILLYRRNLFCGLFKVYFIILKRQLLYLIIIIILKGQYEIIISKLVIITMSQRFGINNNQLFTRKKVCICFD